MPILTLKPTHKVVADYFDELRRLEQHGLSHEGAVSPAFAALLRHCAGQFKWTLAEQHRMHRRGHTIQVDGALLDPYNFVQGVWEAKDTADDLATEIKNKFAAGYPRDNILFQSPDRIILWQDDRPALDAPADRPDLLVDALRAFFEYQPPAIEQWHRAADEFKLKVPEYAQGLLSLIEEERRENRPFADAFAGFATLCREALNPNLSDKAVEEMLVQHILTERLFRRVFQNTEFTERNAIAREIETVARALWSRRFSRDDFMRPLDRFYHAIEEVAATIDDYGEKQAFMNTVYEKFFQGFSVKVADTHGIVYTPQPIVDFMVRSVRHLLKTEFGRALDDPGVHVLDPFVGTGNFIVRTMRALRRARLADKYAGELHCNEVMLLPYYIASMNIEHAYWELAGQYQPFEGICLVDTFETAEPLQRSFAFFTADNTERVKRQQEAPIFVILGNPPYSGHQVNENDNNKNRKYEEVDRRVAETYAQDSRATNKNALSDPYVKAFRWASDRIARRRGDRRVCEQQQLHLTDLAFDGMREHLAARLRRRLRARPGRQRPQEPEAERHDAQRLRHPGGGEHRLPGAAQGRPAGAAGRRFSTRRWRRDWRKEQKYDYLDAVKDVSGVTWQEITPDARHTWLTAGLRDDFATFLPMGTKAAKAGLDAETIFANYGNGVKTNRDTWVYNFSREALEANVRRMMDAYNDHALRWGRMAQKPPVDDFVESDPTKIAWGDSLKQNMARGHTGGISTRSRMRRAAYRPFAQQWLYFDRLLNERVYQLPAMFPR